jgi:hypothetical protein
MDIQEKIISQCEIYDKTCNELANMNELVQNKNIIIEINKLENLYNKN